ncbi:hypothetical protein APHAL10511_005845 [Amanita phalloides]|nr:hypothetical protein APHAL10511_005845 [Amanita phalloides]
MSSTSPPSSFDDSLYADYARDLVYSDPEFKAFLFKAASFFHDTPLISISPAETLNGLNTTKSLETAFSRAYISPGKFSIPPIEARKAAALRYKAATALQTGVLSSSKPTERRPVGILGAGVAGLYAAMILESLKIPYKILEARDVIGGRLFTHRFPNATGVPYNYFDVGAMRFPLTARLDELFKKLGTDFESKIKPYYFSHPNEILYYNGIRRKKKDISGPDPFRAEEIIQDISKDHYTKYIAEGVQNISNDVVEEILHDKKNLLTYDGYSMRAYMHTIYNPSSQPPRRRRLDLPPRSLPTDVINWAQTFDSYYDRGLSEYVLQKKLFSSDKIKWKCIDGGADQIAHHMAKQIRPGGIELKSRVTSIGLSKDGKFMDVVTKTDDGEATHHFSHVISTIPLPALRVVDLSQAKLSTMQVNTIRTLDHGPSVKIGMQFKTAWWREEPLGITGGAQSKTDSPLRTVVYPSYGDGRSTVLIASYCWTADAERLAALIERDKPSLVAMVLEELAKIHDVKLRFLRKQLIDTFAWSWTNNAYTMSSTAAFGPGKFKNVFRSLTIPAADGLLYIAGEALSTRHAWVEGALDSAWRAVCQILLKEQLHDELMALCEGWKASDEWASPLPPLQAAEVATGVAAEVATEVAAEVAAEEPALHKHELLFWYMLARSPDMRKKLET